MLLFISCKELRKYNCVLKEDFTLAPNHRCLVFCLVKVWSVAVSATGSTKGWRSLTTRLRHSEREKTTTSLRRPTPSPASSSSSPFTVTPVLCPTVGWHTGEARYHLRYSGSGGPLTWPRESSGRCPATASSRHSSPPTTSPVS